MNNQNPPLLKRDDYKTIKHMNREDLTKYLYRIYRRGFDAGVESTKGKVAKRSIIPPEPGKKCAAQSEKHPSDGVCKDLQLPLRPIWTLGNLARFHNTRRNRDLKYR